MFTVCCFSVVVSNSSGSEGVGNWVRVLLSTCCCFNAGSSASMTGFAAVVVLMFLCIITLLRRGESLNLWVGLHWWLCFCNAILNELCSCSICTFVRRSYVKGSMGGC